MTHKKQNISVVWDFDKTLTPLDSTTELIEVFLKNSPIEKFWKEVKDISGTKAKRPMESISTSDAPVWMYMLSELANNFKGLDQKGIKKLIAHKITFYPEVFAFPSEDKKAFR